MNVSAMCTNIMSTDITMSTATGTTITTKRKRAGAG